MPRFRPAGPEIQLPGGVSKTIAEAPYRFDVARAVPEFISEPAHMSVDRPGVDDRVVSPDIAKEPVPALNPAVPFHQDAKKFEFRGRTFHHPIGSFYLVAGTIEG